MFSADPPSTPDRRSLMSIPSTTPAGPPPSSNRALPSFTPRGAPPPSSAFGSSQFGTGNSRAKPLFSNRNDTSNGSRGRQLPPSSPPGYLDEDAEGEDDDMMMAGAIAPHVPALEDDSMMIDDSIQQISPGFGFMKSLGGSSRFDSPRGAKRSLRGEVLSPIKHAPRRIEGLDIQGFAKGVAASAPVSKLSDPDDVVLDTELLTEPLLAAIRERAAQEEVAELSAELLKVWQEHGKLKEKEIENEDIGPVNPQAKVAKANMLASLLLLLHISTMSDGQEVPLPRALLNWLDANHDPSANVLEEVLSHKRRGYYGSPGFWDAVYIGLNRGKFSTVIDLFQNAKFEDNAEQDFDSRQVEGIQTAVEGALRILQQCPAVSNQDWNVKGSDWMLWRHRVEQASEELRVYAEEESGGALLWGSTLGQSNLGMSARSRRVDSNIPFEIYEPLQDMYRQLSGSAEDILKGCFDWLEAAIVMTVWWDGSEDKAGKSSLAASRQSLSRKNQTREVDVNPFQAYRSQLASSLALAVREADVREGLDTTNALHLGLACVILDDVEQTVELCKSWSMPIACSLAELASTGQWMADAGSRSNIQNFDKSDLMVLSYGQPEQTSSIKDKLLEQYSRLLSAREVFQSADGESSMEGWEMALRVLGRLDDVEKAQAKVTELLEKIDISSNERVDSVLLLCNDLGFGSHGMAIAERYADHLTATSARYGDALLFHLRAHKFAKAKKVIDVLITSSLIQSTAYPPAKELDNRMKEFISSPKETLNSLAATDLEAAEKLGQWLSGYATLRKFYDLRDKVQNGEGRSKASAATALLAVIESANDPIRGGLFDPSTEIVVPVDTLLVLLGEALPLLRDSSPPAFTQTQLFALLKAIEDLKTIGPRVQEACETLFHTSLDNFFGSDVPSPRAMLRKEASNMTGSSAFSLVGSSLLNSKESMDVDRRMVGSSESWGMVSSGDVKRGWDWRKGLQRLSKGEDVLAILRLAIGERVADAWME